MARPPIAALLVATGIVLLAIATAIVPNRTLFLSATTDRTAYSSGERILITVTVLVGGNRPVSFNDPACDIGFAVVAESGAIIYESGQYFRCAFIRASLLQPGEVRMANFSWTPLPDVPTTQQYVIRPEMGHPSGAQVKIESSPIFLR